MRSMAKRSASLHILRTWVKLAWTLGAKCCWYCRAVGFNCPLVRRFSLKPNCVIEKSARRSNGSTSHSKSIACALGNKAAHTQASGVLEGVVITTANGHAPPSQSMTKVHSTSVVSEAGGQGRSRLIVGLWAMVASTSITRKSNGSPYQAMNSPIISP